MIRLMLLLAAALFLGSCGGGGGGDQSATTPPGAVEETPAPAPFEPGERTTYPAVASVSTGGLYPIHLYLPANLDPQSRYPVLYSLDAEWHFDTIADRLDELELEVILVGVENDRTEGYTHRETYAVWPGANALFLFVRDELAPLIDMAYPTEPADRALMGYSYQGVFVLYAYLIDDAQSPAFQKVVSVDGSVWAQSRMLLEQLEARVADDDEIASSLMMVTATGEDGNVLTMSWYANQIIDAGFTNLKLEFSSYDSAHRDLMSDSLADVLTFLYLSNGLEGQAIE